MATVMYDHGFPQNHVIGGKNMGFWPLGTLGRRVGVVWIRRSFGDDQVYKFALRRYLAHLASKRFNIEWYIEGGRSRSGKLLPPKMGLLNYLVQGVEEAGVEELMLVPVSIVYDKLNEVLEMTAESRGARKRPEGFRWLVRYAHQQSGEQGRVQVRFGEPLALRAALAAGGDGEDQRAIAGAQQSGLRGLRPDQPSNPDHPQLDRDARPPGDRRLGGDARRRAASDRADRRVRRAQRPARGRVDDATAYQRGVARRAR